MPGAASGTTWLGETSPALPNEQPTRTWADRRSIIVTRKPRRNAQKAVLSPAIPAPIITTFPAMFVLGYYEHYSSEIL